MSDELRITKNELSFVEKFDADVLETNKKIIFLRKKSLHDALMDSTIIRTDITKKIKNWLDIIEARLFSPAVINELDINKLMVLMKIVTMYSIKMFNQANGLESLLKSYLSLETIANEYMNSPEKKKEEDMSEFKKTLTKIMMDSLTKTVEVISPNKSEQSETVIVPEVKIDDKLETDNILEELDKLKIEKSG